MNKIKREKLTKVVSLIESATNIVSDIAFEEAVAFDNMPEGLQDSAAGERLDKSADLLDSAVDQLHDAVTSITKAIKL